MAQVYVKQFTAEGEGDILDQEASKRDDAERLDQPVDQQPSRKSSDGESSKQSNVIKVKAEDIIPQNDQNSQDSNIERDSDAKSQQNEDDDNDQSSKENEQSNDGSTGNGLRRSKRMAGNHSSYGLFKRRAFKYDDEFEYSGHIGQKKGAIEMDPPDTGSQGKRKRKNTTLISVPYSDANDRYGLFIVYHFCDHKCDRSMF